MRKSIHISSILKWQNVGLVCSNLYSRPQVMSSSHNQAYYSMYLFKFQIASQINLENLERKTEVLIGFIKSHLYNQLFFP